MCWVSMCYWFKLQIYRLEQIFSPKLKNLKDIFNQVCCFCLIILEIGGPLVSGYANMILRKQSLISAPNHSATGTKHLLDMLEKAGSQLVEYQPSWHHMQNKL